MEQEGIPSPEPSSGADPTPEAPENPTCTAEKDDGGGDDDNDEEEEIDKDDDMVLSEQQRQDESENATTSAKEEAEEVVEAEEDVEDLMAVLGESEAMGADDDGGGGGKTLSSSTTTTKSATASPKKKDVSFLFRSPVQEAEVMTVAQQVRVGLLAALEIIEKEGFEGYRQVLLRRRREELKAAKRRKNKNAAADDNGDDNDDDEEDDDEEDDDEEDLEEVEEDDDEEDEMEEEDEEEEEEEEDEADEDGEEGAEKSESKTEAKKQKKKKKKKTKKSAAEVAEQARQLEEAQIKGDPRHYQLELFNVAKERNTIISLGTGQGKTYIALLCIKHFADAEVDVQVQKKQTLFLVPSVALALQHTTTLRANLPFSVGTACHSSSATSSMASSSMSSSLAAVAGGGSERAHRELLSKDIIVATHGAALDLLMHYGDLFHLKNMNLVVVDECHYAATGNHPYSTIFKKFYHSLPLDQRPHVLGLTASPLVNVKESYDDERLNAQLQHLEGILDSQLACFKGMLQDNGGGPVRSRVDERVVLYHGAGGGESGEGHESLPCFESLPLHTSRKKEFRQLLELYRELGPLATSIYAATLSKEISRNRYDRETHRQFQSAVEYLQLVAAHCGALAESCADTTGGRTAKLAALEELLEQIIEDQGPHQDAVGVVFVERRITALALSDYFRRRLKDLEAGNKWRRVRETIWTRHVHARRPYPTGLVAIRETPGAGGLATATPRLTPATCNPSTTTATPMGPPPPPSTAPTTLMPPPPPPPPTTLMPPPPPPPPTTPIRAPTNPNIHPNTLLYAPPQPPAPDRKLLGGQFDDAEMEPFEAMLNATVRNVIMNSLRNPHDGRRQPLEPSVLASIEHGLTQNLQTSDGRFDDADEGEGHHHWTPNNGVFTDTSHRTVNPQGQSQLALPQSIPLPLSPPHANAVTDKQRRQQNETQNHSQRHGQTAQSQDVDDRFGDAVEDEGATPMQTDEPTGQTSDGENRVETKRKRTTTESSPPREESPTVPTTRIRCNMIVRQTTQVFKYLNQSHRQRTEKRDEMDEPWLHQMKKIREVLDGFRRKEFNVLLATSVVEEGVDVEACSFVVVFDGLRTTKGYVQMKGRARRKDAQFYVFEDSHVDAKPPPVTLESAQRAERRVQTFIATRECNVPEYMPKQRQAVGCDGDLLQTELRALRDGEYFADNGCVDLSSSKSLLNRYVMSIPIDPSYRNSREAMMLHMPQYWEDYLSLPAHLPPGVRIVRIPEEFKDVGKREKHSMLALMGCVRLHGLKLLSSRLLPLKRKDMQSKLLEVALLHLPNPEDNLPPTVPEVDDKNHVYVYRIRQTGAGFVQNDECLGGKGRCLGLLMLNTKLPEPLPNWWFHHKELNCIGCDLGKPWTQELTREEWDECGNFYAVVMNGRWRRRSRNKHFRYFGDKVTSTGCVPWYSLACLKEDGSIDWDRIRRVVQHAQRDEEERKTAVQSLVAEGDLPEPRIWTPEYDTNARYIAFGSSGVTAGAKFPGEHEGVKTYRDYYLEKRERALSEEAPLMAVQRSWHLPRTADFKRGQDELRGTPQGDARDLAELQSKQAKLEQGERAPCLGLSCALLPPQLCLEDKIADAHLFLHLTVLPQILYHVERVLIARAFVRHCQDCLPTLGSLLEQLSLPQVLEVLTARSTGLSVTYERLEWFGDAVLKLLQTDALIYSKELRQWVSYLHEGNLTALRSAMGSNNRLRDVSKSFGIDNFILLPQLGRGQWTPRCLEQVVRDDTGNENKLKKTNILAADKVCADVIEAILGLVYQKFGYVAAVQVANELRVSIPREEDDDDANVREPEKPRTARAARMLTFAEGFLGKAFFCQPHLLEEAITHPSCQHEDVSCYQKLEWIGDAVLCLKARDWIYNHFPQLDVGELVTLEATIVCNETLGYLCVINGLQGHINHRDATLPGRIEEFQRSVGRNGKGLWNTDPPKVLPDVVEALIGAAHMDGGFFEGQKSTLHVLQPVTDAIVTALQSESDVVTKLRARAMIHPKQALYELGGGIFSVRTWRDDDAASASVGAAQVWRNHQWVALDQDEGAGAVGIIYCHGVQVLAVSEKSVHVARNRACALATAVLEQNDDLVLKLRKAVMEEAKSKAKGDENGGGGGSDEEEDGQYDD